MNLEERFWSKVNIGKKTECWEWQRALTEGYGAFWYDGKRVSSNRMVWFLIHKEFPTLYVCHKCDNRKCCNPDHLFLGTHSDNMRDAYNKGRMIIPKIINYGENTGNSKLLNKEVVEIRKLLETKRYANKEIASMFGVSRQTIDRIKNNKGWTNI